MATTTNYSWTTPDNTAYVKDGASAIRTLGSSVDTTLYTALGGAYPGLRLIKKQTIGSAVSSVNVTGAFSSTYENYRIIVSGGVGPAGANIFMKLGSTATGYYYNGYYITSFSSSTLLGDKGENVSAWTTGFASSNGISMDTELRSPNAVKRTAFATKAIGTSASATSFDFSGFLDNDTQYTDFTLTPSSSTLTGGTIYVYGYGAS
jgi:hypothetical protein